MGEYSPKMRAETETSIKTRLLHRSISSRGTVNSVCRLRSAALRRCASNIKFLFSLWMCMRCSSLVVLLCVFVFKWASLVKAYRHLSTLTLILDQVCTEVKCIISQRSSSFDFQLFDCILLPSAMCVCVCNACLALVLGVKAHILTHSLQYVSCVLCSSL